MTIIYCESANSFGLGKRPHTRNQWFYVTQNKDVNRPTCESLSFQSKIT